MTMEVFELWQKNENHGDVWGAPFMLLIY